MKTAVEELKTAPDSESPRVQLLGLTLDALTERQVVDHMMTNASRGRGGWVITPNLDHLRRFTIDPEFAAFFTQAELVVADGMPLVWASRLQGTPLPERVAGSDLIWSLSAAAAERQVPIYLLGGDPGTGEEAARVLCGRFPGLKISGIECPPFGFEKDQTAVWKIIKRLQTSRPGIVFVALGSPKQEQLIATIRGCLPEAWFIGVGISLSFVSGHVTRAPRWMRRMEWLHRLAQEPRRLARRYLIDGLPFLGVLIFSAAATRLRGGGPSLARSSVTVRPANVDQLNYMGHCPAVCSGTSMDVSSKQATQGDCGRDTPAPKFAVNAADSVTDGPIKLGTIER